MYTHTYIYILYMCESVCVCVCVCVYVYEVHPDTGERRTGGHEEKQLMPEFDLKLIFLTREPIPCTFALLFTLHRNVLSLWKIFPFISTWEILPHLFRYCWGEASPMRPPLKSCPPPPRDVTCPTVMAWGRVISAGLQENVGDIRDGSKLTERIRGLHSDFVFCMHNNYPCYC